jgi:hypothetical protein
MEIQMIRFERTRKLKKSAQDFPPIKKWMLSESGQNIQQSDDDHYLSGMICGCENDTH